MTRYKSSRYNFSIALVDGHALFNARTGSVVRFRGADAADFCQTLCSVPSLVRLRQFPTRVAAILRAGGFVVQSGFDELDAIAALYRRARVEAPVVLTLTTTMDCNLGCYYCYEERSPDRLSLDSVSKIVSLARERLVRSRKKSLHVDWYGGEPLLNMEFIEAASAALQALCGELDVSYSASAISNGTRWPNAVGDFVARHRIRQVQISFDGMPTNHNRRRRYVRGREEPTSSFDAAAATVDHLLDHVRVDVRYNVDRSNQADILEFIEFARSRGWFSKKHPAVIQPARLAAYSDASSFMRKHELSLDEFDRLRADVRDAVAGEAAVEESEAPEGAAFPKVHVCAALAHDSDVIGADGRLYRCGLQVSEGARSLGTLPHRRSLPLAQVAGDAEFWASFDPTRAPNCSRCSFLPVCWGGCPKRHLEGDRHALAEQGAYWRKNLPRLIAARMGAVNLKSSEFSERDQFRGA